jgi:hypothetical protein
MVFHLPLRQTQGVLRSLAEKLEVEIPIPDHTTLSRRVTMPISGCPTATEWGDSHSGAGEPALSSEPCNKAALQS